MEAKRIEELDKKSEELFDQLVPACGKAETIGGEMLRATMRMIYRYFNDGDVVNSGYGIETCMSSFLYLEDTMDVLGLICKEDNNGFWDKRECNPHYAAMVNRSFHYTDDDLYQDALYRLMELVLDFIENSNAAKQENTADSRNWRRQDVDLMIADYEAEYEEEDY